jgi:hypothetical protein
MRPSTQELHNGARHPTRLPKKRPGEQDLPRYFAGAIEFFCPTEIHGYNQDDGPGRKVQGAKTEARAFLSPDGRYPQSLFFATDRGPTNEKDLKGDNLDIYFLTRQGPRTEFTTLTPVQSECTPEDEMHPWLTADRLHLYFSRKTKEGWRVYVASKPRSGGAFGDPKLVNLPAGFHHPTRTPDGRTMYLLSRDGQLLYFASDPPAAKAAWTCGWYRQPSSTSRNERTTEAVLSA